MEMHSVANLATFSDFFPFKKAPKPYLVSDNRWYCRERERGLAFPARAHLSRALSHSVCLLSFCSVHGREEQFNFSFFIQLNTDIILLASLILHASIAKITAQLLSLSYVYLISRSDDGSIIRIFVQINILEVRAACSLNRPHFIHYFILIPLSDNRNS